MGSEAIVGVDGRLVHLAWESVVQNRTMIAWKMYMAFNNQIY